MEEKMTGKKNWYEGVPAPVDVDGNVVPLTTRTLYDGTGREVEVGEITLVDAGLRAGYGSVWRVREVGGPVLELGFLHLECPDTWERLEEEVERLASGYGARDYFDVAGRRDRKAHDCDEDGFCCELCITRDILRRAKALAGRGEGQ